MNNKILFVDDDENILVGIQRQLRKRFPVEGATNGVKGLEMIIQNGPFAVVVADMRMPGMDGIQFLTEVKRITPDVTRMMLTGNADLQTAINAVNNGNIFRFLTKPCPSETLIQSLAAGIEQYRLIHAEKDLLEKTLVGSIRMLMEILSVVNPKAFSKSTRVRTSVVHIVEELELEDAWQYEIAATLSQIGWITFPPDLLDKVTTNRTLTENEETLYSKHPLVGRALLEKIPRLEKIALMVEKQRSPLDDLDFNNLKQKKDIVNLGSQILKVALDFDQFMMTGLSYKEALSKIKDHESKYMPEVLDALSSYATVPEGYEGREYRDVSLDNLDLGMIFAEDLYDLSGEIIISKGEELTYSILTSLYSMSRRTNYLKGFYRVFSNHP